eukprot:CAMPEP_0176419310 /NCGR_PEP_ID=MMETSP0127-20121128/7974_1 /TAXON_ID=938130 /ORGANISM="Platyophrya macrostoma, Strain WH" /LENGTH=314 /DNA_ID=CAMNT_0017799769 /DNA_START=143 /DNA_END=1087 /DNA_ORIENTATION=+
MAPKIAKYKCLFTFSGKTFEHEDTIYTLASKQDCLNFRNFADSDDGFVLRYDDKNVVVWDKKVEGESMRIVKVFSLFPDTAPEQLWDLLQESVYRLKWDLVCKKCKTIVRMDSRNDICYYASKCPPGVSDRDVVCQRGWHNAGNGEYVILNTSVKHNSCPEKLTYTRAWSKLSGYLIRPHEKGSSLIFISQTDPKGLIPHALMNQLMTKFVPDTMCTLQRAAKGFPEFLKSEGDKFKRDWDLPADPWDVPVPDITLDIIKSRWFSGSSAPPPVEEVVSPDSPMEEQKLPADEEDVASPVTDGAVRKSVIDDDDI